MSGGATCPCCGGKELRPAFSYDAPPVGETAFPIAPGEYRREYRVCATCGHWLGVTEIDLTALYDGGYVDATYTDKGVPETFERIMALPPERSDNVQRADRIEDFWAGRDDRSLLDVGSGLGVFPARMKAAGWACTAVDPDPRAAAFLSDRIGVEGIQGDFFTVEGLSRYPLVTLNKVLEHVADPAAMLDRARGCLEPTGTAYLEVPDGERAARDPDGQGREEFFIEHLHVFSPASLTLVARRAGLDVLHLARLREPSGKYTLYAFCEAAPGTRNNLAT